MSRKKYGKKGDFVLLLVTSPPWLIFLLTVFLTSPLFIYSTQRGYTFFHHPSNRSMPVSCTKINNFAKVKPLCSVLPVVNSLSDQLLKIYAKYLWLLTRPCNNYLHSCKKCLSRKMGQKCSSKRVNRNIFKIQQKCWSVMCKIESKFCKWTSLLKQVSVQKLS